MSNDPNASEHFGPQMAPPPSQGGSKVWLVLGLGCGFVLLLCCGGLVGIGFFAKNAVQVAQGPEAAQQQGDQIAEFELPAGFKAASAFGMKNPLSGEPLMTWVIYTGSDHESDIYLMEFGSLMDSLDQEQMRMQMEQQMQQQGRPMKRLNISESRDVDIQIRGQQATFKIKKAEDPQTKEPFVEFEGVFQGKQARALIVGQVKKTDGFTEDDAEKFVRSIK